MRQRTVNLNRSEAKLRLRPRDDNYLFFVPWMAPNVATCAQAVGCSVLDPDRRSGGGAVNNFSVRYLSCSPNKVIRVALRIVPWEQAPTIRSDWLVEMRWFSLAGENHLGMRFVYV